MQNGTFNTSAKARRKGLAKTSLVLGIVSIPTVGLLVVGAIVGLVLGIIAWLKAKRSPQEYGGIGLAIAGTTTSALSLFLIVPITAAIAIPHLISAQQTAREASAIEEVNNICQAQVLYSMTKGGGQFTDLSTLASEGLIDPELGSGQKLGYVFASGPVLAQAGPPMFDVSARPVQTGTFGTGKRSFYSNEASVVYEREGIQPPTATPLDRRPKDGSPVF